MKSELTEKLTSSASDLWRTPDPLVQLLSLEFPIAVDVAASRTNRKTREYFGLDHPSKQLRDALGVDWARYARMLARYLKLPWVALFENPPFSLLEDFTRKTFEERQKGAVIVCVYPHKTETIPFQEIVGRYADEIRELKGRLNYLMDDGSSPAPALFPSSVAIFNGRAPLFASGPRRVLWDWRRDAKAKGIRLAPKVSIQPNADAGEQPEAEAEP